MTPQAETVIVGGGIWGLSTAYHLAKLGRTDVRVLERNEGLFSETTPRAAGNIGQIRTTPLLRRAVEYAIDLYSGFEQETGHDSGFRQVGSLFLALTPEQMADDEEQVENANKSGVEAEFVDGANLVRLAPHVDVSRIQGGYFVPKDGYVDPKQCAGALAAAAEDLGVRTQTGTTVTGLSVRNGRIAGVETNRGLIEAEHVIVTSGVWSGLITEIVDYEPPMAPIRHQRVTTVPADDIPDQHPVVRVTEISCYLRPEGDGYLYGFFDPDPTSYDLKDLALGFRTQDIEDPVEVMDEARNRLVPVFPILESLQVAKYKAGLTPFTPDGGYLIGPISDVDGLFVATGCGCAGIIGSAAVGRWLANWVTQDDPGDDLSAFAPHRFGEKVHDREWVRRAGKQQASNYYGSSAVKQETS